MNSDAVQTEVHDLDSLCAAYCPPLEAGLVYAIASDFDLNDENSLREVRRTLDELQASAAIEQDLELLPQGDGNNGAHKTLNAHSSHEVVSPCLKSSSQRSETSPEGTTEEDEVTSVTTGVSGLMSSDLDGSENGQAVGYGEASIDFAQLSNEEKCEWLCGMFPACKLDDVKNVLARCDGNFDRSTDELLNVSFLKERNEDHIDQDFDIPKGVDAFLQDENAARRPKMKGKSRRKQNRADHLDSMGTWNSDSAVSSGVTTPNVWKDLPEDVDFIVSRTHLKPKAVTSLYHANGARLAPTIRALATKEGQAYRKNNHIVDEIVEMQMDELRLEYGNVMDAQIYGVLALTNNIPSAAKELIDAMVTSNEQPVLLGKVTGLASYTPVNLSEDESKSRKVPSSTWSTDTPGNGATYTTSHLANNHGVAAQHAFQQASAAYRRGKSDHLMGGAAAYYASVGHEKIKAAKSSQAAAADAHVAAQSSPTVLDLHGVNVSDAVRIAQKGTEAWWHELGDRKYVVGGIGLGYRIVTGVGRHSSDGIGRIGPAVSKMLVREGWRVAIGSGEVVVSGRARK